MSAPESPLLLWIDWKDHCSSHGWLEADRYDASILTITTVGFLFHEDSETITLANTCDHQTPAKSGDRQQILKCCIVGEWELAFQKRS